MNKQKKDQDKQEIEEQMRKIMAELESVNYRNKLEWYSRGNSLLYLLFKGWFDFLKHFLGFHTYVNRYSIIKK